MSLLSRPRKCSWKVLCIFAVLKRCILNNMKMRKVYVLVFFYHLIATATCLQNTNILISEWNRYFKDLADSDDWESKFFSTFKRGIRRPTLFFQETVKFWWGSMFSLKFEIEIFHHQNVLVLLLCSIKHFHVNDKNY